MYRYTESLGNRIDGINQMAHFRDLFEPGLISGGPNRDTLYSTGWFDVSEDPVVISLPDFEGRYFVVQLTDLYSHNFKNVGSHLLNADTRRYQTGHQFMLAGPDWQGEVPDGVELVRAPVNVFHFLLRIAVQDDPMDLAVGRKLQEE